MFGVIYLIRQLTVEFEESKKGKRIIACMCFASVQELNEGRFDQGDVSVFGRLGLWSLTLQSMIIELGFSVAISSGDGIRIWS